MKLRAFTLIEVIITTALIALLAVASYPTLSAVQKKQAVDSDVTILEACYLTAAAYAKAPSSANTDTVVLEYRVGTDSCHVIERSASGDQEKLSYTLAGGNDYDMRFPNQSAGQNIKAELQIKATAPYQKAYLNGGSDLKIELIKGGSVVGETTINTEFGTVL